MSRTPRSPRGLLAELVISGIRETEVTTGHVDDDIAAVRNASMRVSGARTPETIAGPTSAGVAAASATTARVATAGVEPPVSAVRGRVFPSRADGRLHGRAIIGGGRTRTTAPGRPPAAAVDGGPCCCICYTNRRDHAISPLSTCASVLNVSSILPDVQRRITPRARIYT